MPTVEFSTGDFLHLVGKRVPLKEIEERAAMLGTSVEEVSEDKVVIEVFPNRPDLLSVEGFARAYKTFTGLENGLVDYRVEDSEISLKVDSSVRSVRPYIASAIVKNLPVTEDVLLSIIGIQEALHGSHGRKRAKVAIGIHDFDKTSPPYEYKAMKPDSMSFTPLDFSEEMTLGQALKKHPKGLDYGHIIEGKKLVPVVLDKKGIVSLPPVINADRTRVTGSTSNLFIEMTGTNEVSLRHALNIVVTSLADRGGQIVSVNVGGLGLDLSPSTMVVECDYVNRLLGLELSANEMGSLLTKMGYGTGKKTQDKIWVLVPCYRADVLHPIDVVEDIAIAYGYENFKPEETRIPMIGKPDPLEETSYEIRLLAIGLGFQEVVPFTLTNPKSLQSAGISAKPVRIKNPRTEEFTVLRNSCVSSLLDTLAYNKKKRLPQKIFELDDVICGKQEWENSRKIGLAILDQEVNFSDMQSAVESLLRNLGTKYRLLEKDGGGFIGGRCAEISINGKRAGFFGEIHPQVLSDFGLEYPVVLAEIDATIL